MSENSYKEIKRTIEIIEEKIPVANTNGVSQPNRPSWIALIGLTITVVSVLISLAEYLDRKKGVQIDKPSATHQEQTRYPSPEELDRLYGKSISESRERIRRKLKRRRKRARKRTRRRYYNRRIYDRSYDR